MIYENLNDLTYFELKKMAIEMGLKIRRSKKDLIQTITKAFNEYNDYKKEKIDKYKQTKKLGEGKEGTTYLVTDINDYKYAMKTFRKQKFYMWRSIYNFRHCNLVLVWSINSR